MEDVILLMHEHEFDDICEKLGFSCALEHFDTGD
jgi:hypothetical protein